MINIYSEFDNGTVFKFYWPVSDTSSEATEAAPAVSIKGGEETILLIEDE